MFDRTTKLLLAAIALGLWANPILNFASVSPARAEVQETILLSINNHLMDIRADIQSLSQGTCDNPTLC